MPRENKMFSRNPLWEKLATFYWENIYLHIPMPLGEQHMLKKHVLLLVNNICLKE